MLITDNLLSSLYTKCLRYISSVHCLPLLSPSSSLAAWRRFPCVVSVVTVSFTYRSVRLRPSSSPISAAGLVLELHVRPIYKSDMSIINSAADAFEETCGRLASSGGAQHVSVINQSSSSLRGTRGNAVLWI